MNVNFDTAAWTRSMGEYAVQAQDALTDFFHDTVKPYGQSISSHIRFDATTIAIGLGVAAVITAVAYVALNRKGSEHGAKSELARAAAGEAAAKHAAGTLPEEEASEGVANDEAKAASSAAQSSKASADAEKKAQASEVAREAVKAAPAAEKEEEEEEVGGLAILALQGLQALRQALEGTSN